MRYQPSLAPALYTSADSRTDRHYQDLMAQQDRTPVGTDGARPRVSLVVGPSPFTMPRGWEFFLTSPYEGVTYIASVLHNAGYPVRLIDVRYDLDPLGSAYRQVMEGTDVLGIATFEDNYPFVRQLIEDVKDAVPSMPVICGGSLVTSVPHVFMSDTRTDVAVISEGEITILELMDAYEAGHWPDRLADIHGIWYRAPGGEVAVTPPRGQMRTLDALPRMNLGLWPQSRGPGGLQPQVIASYSRGCKMDCSFCYRTTPQERVKSLDKLDRDLAHLRSQYNVDFVFFVDLTFTAHKGQTLEVCDVIKGHGLRWTCLTRCADVDPERLRAMKDAGADIILYGVESLAPNILKTARKGNSENLANRAMWQTWDAGIRFGGLMIVGLPGETPETLDRACRWAEQFQHLTRVKYLSAMPGTTVYQQAVASGAIRSEVDHLNWLAIEQALPQDEFLNLNGLDERLVRDSYRRLYDSYQPGPVMDFRHFPEHFDYFHPSDRDGTDAAVAYAGRGWRAAFSSAGPRRMADWRRYSLERTGTTREARTGSRLAELYVL